MDKKETIELLIQLVNRKFGLTPDSPADFEALSKDIFAHTDRTVSASTLKRMWGYVAYASMPSPATLASLSLYVGFPDWSNFVEHAKFESVNDTSGFLQEVVVNSSELVKGAVVEVEWTPDKSITMEYIGRQRFKVLHSSNIKLIEGDIFKMQSVSIGLPFYALDIVRKKLRIPGYIGARPAGVTSIRLLPQD